MAIPSVVQGLIETGDGKVFELDSPKGAAWVEAISSFRFEPTGDSKACTIRREPSGYWYGCRKIAGKVRKKYIGKTSEISTAKLEEIAEALEVPPAARASKVAEVAQEVAENTRVAEKVTEVAQEVAENRLTALELEVANLRKALEALQEALPGKSEAGDSEELPKVDNAVVEELQNELSNLKAEDKYLRQKFAESRDTVEMLNWGTEALNEQLATANQTIAERNEKIESLKQELAENTRYYTARLNEAGATVSTFKDKLEAAQAKNQRLQNELGNLQAEREELAQLKKEAKEAAAEVHREGRSIELEKVRWQRELSDARAELADAKATMLNQGNKIRELERGYSLQPNPAERRLRLEIGELQAELAELKQKAAAANQDLLEAADLYNQLKTRRKKSSASLADVELILEMIEES
jgi:DNA repair exonuclease SbcCD ATPase subunit